MKASLKLRAALLLSALSSAGALQAQPEDLVGFRLGQPIAEIQKVQGYKLRKMLRGATDRALQACGMETYQIQHDRETLQITVVRGLIVKLDLGKSFEVLNPYTMANNFVSAYGSPRQVFCKHNGEPKQHERLSQCGKTQRYVELEYWWGESEPDQEVRLRVRLRSQGSGADHAFSRLTLSRGWDQRVAKLEPCVEKAVQQQEEIGTTREGARSDIPSNLRRSTSAWQDPRLDSGWVGLYQRDRW